MTTTTLHPLVQNYKGRITEAFESEGYTVLAAIVDEDEGRVAIDYEVEDRENDRIPDVRIWFYPDEFESVGEDGVTAFQPDFVEHAWSVDGRLRRDPEQVRQLEEIFTKHFDEGLDFSWME